MTFSVVAWDSSTPDGAEWGVAVASKFLAAGSVVPWARSGAGAVATQALANISYGPRGLDLIEGGASAHGAIEALTSVDEDRDHRQVGIVDLEGRAATFTGADCLPWAGGRIADGVACQGNILTGPEVVDAMMDAYENSDGDLAHRLTETLLAGDRAGGDSRGRQSAALLVVRSGGGYLGDSDVLVDLRVDDHLDPVPELARLLSIHGMLFPNPSDLEFIDLDADVLAELRELLGLMGTDVGATGDQLRRSLLEFVGTENLEARWRDDSVVELGVLEHLRHTASGR